MVVSVDLLQSCSTIIQCRTYAERKSGSDQKGSRQGFIVPPLGA